VGIILYFLIFASVFVTAYISLHLYLDKKASEKINVLKSVSKDKIYQKINKILKNKKDGYFSFSRIESYLIIKGNPLNISPGAYLVMKFFCSILMIFAVFGISKNLFIAIFGIILGFFFIDLCLYISDKSDMKKIRFDLADVYDLVNIQTSAGVSISNAILDAYLTVRNKRFKRDLAVLSAEISITNDINRSLDSFEKKYNAVEINSFVMAIKQSIITGQTEKIFDDISDSLKESNFFSLQEEGNKIKSTKMIIQMLMYVGILSVIIFELFIEISKSWGGMFS
jgi:Flp pilus assembly protein TadB